MLSARAQDERADDISKMSFEDWSLDPFRSPGRPETPHIPMEKSSSSPETPFFSATNGTDSDSPVAGREHVQPVDLFGEFAVPHERPADAHAPLNPAG